MFGAWGGVVDARGHGVVWAKPFFSNAAQVLSVARETSFVWFEAAPTRAPANFLLSTATTVCAVIQEPEAKHSKGARCDKGEIPLSFPLFFIFTAIQSLRPAVTVIHFFLIFASVHLRRPAVKVNTDPSCFVHHSASCNIYYPHISGGITPPALKKEMKYIIVPNKPHTKGMCVGKGTVSDKKEQKQKQK